jgi:hypothetical protein
MPDIEPDELEWDIHKPVQGHIPIELVLIGHQAIKHAVNQTPGIIGDTPFSYQYHTDNT